MDGPGDEVLSCASLAEDQNGRLSCRNRFDLLENSLQFRLLADNVLEPAFRTKLFFEVPLLLLESVAQLRDVAERQSVVQGGRHGVRELGQHTQIFLGKGGLLLAKHAECAEPLVAANRGEPANLLGAGRRYITRGLRCKKLLTFPSLSCIAVTMAQAQKRDPSLRTRQPSSSDRPCAAATRNNSSGLPLSMSSGVKKQEKWRPMISSAL